MASNKLTGVDTATGQESAVTIGSGVALTNDVLTASGGAAGTQRIVASGSTTVSSTSEVTINTFTRNTSERVMALVFLQGTDTTQGLGEGTVYPSGTGMLYAFRVGGASDQNRLAALIGASANAHTLDWAILGVVP